MEENQSGKGDRECWLGVGSSDFKRVVIEGFNENMTFEQRPKGGE